MFTKSILTATATAIALAAGLGSASADENFSTIAGLSAQPLSAHELAKVRGTEWLIFTRGHLVVLNDSACILNMCGHHDMLVFGRERPEIFDVHTPC